MALFSITAVLTSGKRLPSVEADASWTGRQVKDAFTQLLEKGFVSALFLDEKLFDVDATLEQLLEGMPEVSRCIDLTAVVSEPPTLAEAAELPRKSTEYVFKHWSGDEIYPDEEGEYLARAAETEVYLLKSKAGKDEFVLHIAMPAEWISAWDECFEDTGNEPDRRFTRENFTLLRRLIGAMPVDELLKQAVCDHFEGLDRIDFSISNNAGATAEYQIIDGTSAKSVKFADSEQPLYLIFTGKAVFRRTDVEMRLSAIFWSNDQSCGVHRPFFM